MKGRQAFPRNDLAQLGMGGPGFAADGVDELRPVAAFA